MTASFPDWDSRRSPTLQQVFDELPTTMEQRPFGRDADGRPLDLATGAAIVPFVEHTLRVVADQRVAAAASLTVAGEAELRSQSRADTLDELLARLNGVIDDPADEISEAHLLDPTSRYSVEFDEYLSKFCFELAGSDPEFHLRAADECFPEALITLAKPLTIRQAYVQFTRTSRWSHAELMYAEPAGPNCVTIKWSSSNVAAVCSNEVWRSYTRSTCDYLSSMLAALPREHSELPRSRFRERSCQLHGADFCTWEFTWQESATTDRRWAYAGLAASAALAAASLLGVPGASVIAWIATLPFLLGIIATQTLSHRAERDQREQLLAEQHELAEQGIDRNLRANVELQRVNHDLVERHREIEAMHGMAASVRHLLSTDALLEAALRQIVDNLGFDRAAALLVDASPAGGDHDTLIHRRSSHPAAPESDGSDYRQPLGPQANTEDPLVRAFGSDEPLEVSAHRDGSTTTYGWLKGVTEWLAVPLIADDGRRMGVLVVDNRVRNRPMAETDAPLLTTAATRIADALAGSADYRAITSDNDKDRPPD